MVKDVSIALLFDYYGSFLTEKQADICIYRENKELGGIAVKFIMSNYSQNSNNYFESMLGETANIRSGGKAYFQIIVLPEQLPYFSNGDDISEIETVTSHYLSKYIKLSDDNPKTYMHTPDKTLLYLIKTSHIDTKTVKTREQFVKFLLSDGSLNIHASEKSLISATR